MTVTDRVRVLRQASLDAVPSISAERALLLTRYYRQSCKMESKALERAKVFKFLLENKVVKILDGELIVGEKGMEAKAAPTFPELCCHSLADLDLLNSREKIPFKVSAETRRVFETQIIPYWKGRSLREALFERMSKQWTDAYEAGIFTEFMEQRAPGHTVLDDKIYHHGMEDFINDIHESIERLDFLNDARAYDKQEELKAMSICARALIAYANRYADAAEELAGIEMDPQRKDELLKIAGVCRRVPAKAPANFWEALQYYWFVHIGVTTELNTWDAFDPGRLDQHLDPFYRQGLAEGSLTRESAEELLQCFWIKFNNQPAPPKVGVTAAESGTYTDFAQINVGGLKTDGGDGVNDVSFLLLDVIEEMRLLQPSSSIQVSKKNPDRFIKRATRIIRTGFGQPSVFNADAIVQELVRMGKTVEDARQGGSSGCVEIGAFGKENYNLTGYFNLPKVLEITLHNGMDPRTGKQIGLKTGKAQSFKDFESLYQAFAEQLKYFLEIKIRGNQIIERLYAEYMPAPFLSILIDDCIKTGLDYHNGGARYNSTYIQGVGLGSITDQLSAIKYHVFEQKTLALEELVGVMDANFEGQERLRQTLINKGPHYGNDDDRADDLLRRVFESYFELIDGRPNTKGGHYRINLLPTTCHIYFGSVTGATAEGRLAGKPLSEGISPVQGADRNGPTAVLKSAAKIDHLRTGGTLLNQKFTPSLLAGDEGLDKLVQLIRTYFKLDGHHIQFNVVDAATLHEAQAHPEQHRDLIVRVAGYSDYFCDLSPALQDEIIDRTEHQGF